MAPENTNNIITRKIRIYPTQKQKLFFNKCFGISRFIYNKAVQYVHDSYTNDINNFNSLREQGCIFNNCHSDIDPNSKYFCNKHSKKKLNYSFNVNRIHIRNNILVNDKDLTPDMKWQSDIPYDTRELVINDYCTAYKACISNLKRKNINYFKFRFKSKKDNTQMFHINKKAITKDLDLFKRRKIGKLRVRKRMKKWLKNHINKIDCNCKIIRYNPNQYYLLLSIKKEDKYTKAPLNVVSLDPGVRTFQTFYSPVGVCGKIGNNFKDKINRINERIDNLKSKLSKLKKRTKRNLRNRISLLRTKTKNMINDLHWKTAHFLCKNFNIILLPEFKTKEMSNTKDRNIGKQTTRELLSLCHYSFQMKLKYKCEALGRKMMIVNESYTSKTCGNCGHIDNKLGSKKEYECLECGYKIDRDINGARNILLKHL